MHGNHRCAHFNSTLKRSMCPFSVPSQSERASVHCTCPELKTCAVGAGSPRPTAHVWSSGHVQQAPPRTLSLGAKEGQLSQSECDSADCTCPELQNTWSSWLTVHARNSGHVWWEPACVLELLLSVGKRCQHGSPPLIQGHELLIWEGFFFGRTAWSPGIKPRQIHRAHCT